MSDPYLFAQSRTRFSAKHKAALCEAYLNAEDPDQYRVMLEQQGYSGPELDEMVAKYLAGGATALKLRAGGV